MIRKTAIAAAAALALAAGVASASPASAATTTWHNAAHATAHGAFTLADATAFDMVHRPSRIQTVATKTGTFTVSWTTSCVAGWSYNSRSGSFKVGSGVHVHAISLPAGSDCTVDANAWINGGSLTLRIQHS